MALRGALVAMLVLVSGCVATARTRPTSSEATAGPPPPPVADQTAAQLVARTPRSPTPDATPDPKSRPGYVWVHGYWHWDGVSFVYKPARWERKAPRWARGR